MCVCAHECVYAHMHVHLRMKTRLTILFRTKMKSKMVELDPWAISEKNWISCLVSLSAGILLEKAAPSRPNETTTSNITMYPYSDS